MGPTSDATAVGFRRPDPQSMRLISWKPIQNGALLAFATVELPIGLKLVDFPVLIGSHGLAPAGPELAIEGIENALTIIAATGMPAWPAVSKSGFKSLALPHRG